MSVDLSIRDKASRQKPVNMNMTIDDIFSLTKGGA